MHHIHLVTCICTSVAWLPHFSIYYVATNWGGQVGIDGSVVTSLGLSYNAPTNPGDIVRQRTTHLEGTVLRVRVHTCRRQIT